MQSFHGNSADEVWRQAHQILSDPNARRLPQPSRSGDTIEVLHVAFEISNPRLRWVTSRWPAMNPALGIAEALWTLAGQNDADTLAYWFPGLRRFAGDGPVFYGAYGPRLRRQFGVDQLLAVCEALRSNQASRQAVLQIWDPRTDLPVDRGLPRDLDVPCNIVSLLKVRDGKLEWTQVMRSTDIYRGLPYDFLQFTLLQEVIAGWIGVDVGSYAHWSDSLHYYVDDYAKLSSTPIADPYDNSDVLLIAQDVGLSLVHDLYDRLVGLTKPGLSDLQLAKLASLPQAPLGYQNLLRILGAESARRRDRSKLAGSIMSDCTNPVLRAVWRDWERRVSGNGSI